MLINVSENIRITSDGSHNFIIQERCLIKSTKEGVADRYEWKNVGYYGRVEHACESLIDVLGIRLDTIGEVKDLIQQRQQLIDGIVSAIRRAELV